MIISLTLPNIVTDSLLIILYISVVLICCVLYIFDNWWQRRQPITIWFCDIASYHWNDMKGIQISFFIGKIKYFFISSLGDYWCVWCYVAVLGGDIESCG